MKSCEKYVSSKSNYYVYTASATAKKLFFYPTHLGYFYYLPHYFQKRERFDSFLIMLITNGSCEITVQNHTLTAKKGQVVLIDCYAPHEYGSKVSFETAWLHFDGPMARAYYTHLYTLYGNILTPAAFQKIYALFNNIYSMFSTNIPIKEPLLSHYISSMLIELIMNEKDSSKITSSNLEDVLTYINEHFKEPLTLENLAKQAALSPFYFTRLFTKETGCSPHQYIIATRISHAKYLLKSTQLSIKQIAFSCGFTSESGFCAQFKKCEHITPSEYRYSSV